MNTALMDGAVPKTICQDCNKRTPAQIARQLHASASSSSRIRCKRTANTLPPARGAAALRRSAAPLQPSRLHPPGSALAQLQERGYADKYRARGEPIHLIGVEFSRATRNLTAFEVADA